MVSVQVGEHRYECGPLITVVERVVVAESVGQCRSVGDGVGMLPRSPCPGVLTTYRRLQQGLALNAVRRDGVSGLGEVGAQGFMNLQDVVAREDREKGRHRGGR